MFPVARDRVGDIAKQRPDRRRRNLIQDRLVQGRAERTERRTVRPEATVMELNIGHLLGTQHE
jgi:hypothetical protein